MSFLLLFFLGMFCLGPIGLVYGQTESTEIFSIHDLAGISDTSKGVKIIFPEPLKLNKLRFTYFSNDIHNIDSLVFYQVEESVRRDTSLVSSRPGLKDIKKITNSINDTTLILPNINNGKFILKRCLLIEEITIEKPQFIVKKKTIFTKAIELSIFTERGAKEFEWGPNSTVKNKINNEKAWILDKLSFYSSDSIYWFTPKLGKRFPTLKVDNLLIGASFERKFFFFKRMKYDVNISPKIIFPSFGHSIGFRVIKPEKEGKCDSYGVLYNGIQQLEDELGKFYSTEDIDGKKTFRLDLISNRIDSKDVYCDPLIQVIFKVPTREDLVFFDWKEVNWEEYPELYTSIESLKHTYDQDSVRGDTTRLVNELKLELEKNLITPCENCNMGGSAQFTIVPPKESFEVNNTFWKVVYDNRRYSLQKLDSLSKFSRDLAWRANLSQLINLEDSVIQSDIPLINNQNLVLHDLRAGFYTLHLITDSSSISIDTLSFPFSIPPALGCTASERILENPIVNSECLSKRRYADQRIPCQQDQFTIDLKSNEVVIVSLEKDHLEELDINSLFTVNPYSGKLEFIRNSEMGDSLRKLNLAYKNPTPYDESLISASPYISLNNRLDQMYLFSNLQETTSSNVALKGKASREFSKDTQTKELASNSINGENTEKDNSDLESEVDEEGTSQQMVNDVALSGKINFSEEENSLYMKTTQTQRSGINRITVKLHKTEKVNGLIHVYHKKFKIEDIRN